MISKEMRYLKISINFYYDINEYFFQNLYLKFHESFRISQDVDEHASN